MYYYRLQINWVFLKKSVCCLAAADVLFLISRTLPSNGFLLTNVMACLLFVVCQRLLDGFVPWSNISQRIQSARYSKTLFQTELCSRPSYKILSLPPCLYWWWDEVRYSLTHSTFSLTLFLGEINTGTWPSRLKRVSKIETIEYAHESRGTQIWERLCLRCPAKTKTTDLNSRQRGRPTSTNTQRSKNNQCVLFTKWYCHEYDWL
jgi:hypothetical protein